MEDLNLPKKRLYLYKAQAYKRIGAFVLDLLIINFIIVGPFTSILQNIMPNSSISSALNSNPLLQNQVFFIGTIIAFLSLLYFSWFTYKLSQTPGMMALKLYKISKNNQQITFMQALLSNVFILPMFPFFILWIIDPIYLIFKKETLSNQLSKTQIVETLISN